MRLSSPRRFRSGKIINNSYLIRNSSGNHPSIDSDQNVDSVSNSIDIHRKGTTLNSQLQINNQIWRLQAQMRKNKNLLSTLTQQVISCPEEGNALPVEEIDCP